MKKYLFAAGRLLAAAAIVLLIAIPIAKNKTVQSSAPVQTVFEAVSAKVDMSLMQQGDPQMVRRLYGLDPAAYEACILYYPNTNMGAEELLLVKLKDGADPAPLRAAAEKRVADQLNVFEGYGPAQVALLKEHAVIEAPGNYFLFVVSETAAEAAAAFYEVL